MIPPSGVVYHAKAPLLGADVFHQVVAPPISSVIAAIGLPLSRCSHKLLYCCAASIQVFFFEFLEILRMLYPAVPYIRIDYVANYI